jgi:hypothetical protein
MKIELVPLLQLQRDLYTIPRSQERFRTYLETIINTDGSDLEVPPLAFMNPMGKDHIARILGVAESKDESSRDWDIAKLEVVK